MKVIILSAGQGRRLMPLTANCPKCALPVAGRPILAWQLSAINRCSNISEVVVVTGFAADKIEAVIAENNSGHLAVRALYNPFFANSDNLATCWVARHEMQEPFVLINGDTLFEPAVIQRLAQGPAKASITLTVDKKADYDDDDMKVILDQGRLCHVGKKLNKSRVNGESIGMTRFDHLGAELFCAELERSMRLGEGVNRWYLAAIDAIAQKQSLGACLIEGLNWCEIDTREDLNYADQALLDWANWDDDQTHVLAKGG